MTVIAIGATARTTWTGGTRTIRSRAIVIEATAWTTQTGGTAIVRSLGTVVGRTRGKRGAETFRLPARGGLRTTIVVATSTMTRAIAPMINGGGTTTFETVRRTGIAGARRNYSKTVSIVEANLARTLLTATLSASYIFSRSQWTGTLVGRLRSHL